MINTKPVTVRELQHNLSSYIDLAKTKPLKVTRYGISEVIMLDPSKYDITEKKPVEQLAENIMDSPFVGMYKNDKKFKNRSALEIAQELREKSWYGK